MYCATSPYAFVKTRVPMDAATVMPFRPCLLLNRSIATRTARSVAALSAN